MTFRLFVLISGCAAVVLAGPGKTSKDLEKPAPGATVQVTVQHRNLPGPDLPNRVAAKGGKIGGTSPTLSSSAAWGNLRAFGEFRRVRQGRGLKQFGFGWRGPVSRARHPPDGRSTRAGEPDYTGLSIPQLETILTDIGPHPRPGPGLC
jgi:hypothetical protein